MQRCPATTASHATPLLLGNPAQHHYPSLLGLTRTDGLGRGELDETKPGLHFYTWVCDLRTRATTQNTGRIRWTRTTTRIMVIAMLLIGYLYLRCGGEWERAFDNICYTPSSVWFWIWFLAGAFMWFFVSSFSLLFLFLASLQLARQCSPSLATPTRFGSRQARFSLPIRWILRVHMTMDACGKGTFLSLYDSTDVDSPIL